MKKEEKLIAFDSGYSEIELTRLWVLLLNIYFENNYHFIFFFLIFSHVQSDQAIRIWASVGSEFEVSNYNV